MLKVEEKKALQTAREGGMFGGMSGKAPYMWVQEGSTPGGAAGAQAAGLRKPRLFIKNALDRLDIVGHIGSLLMQ